MNLHSTKLSLADYTRMGDEHARSERILKLLVSSIFRDTMTPVIYHELQTRAVYGKAEAVKPSKGELTQRAVIFKSAGRDIYGQEKSTEVRYCECLNCKRQVANLRFAAHVARCYVRGRRN